MSFNNDDNKIKFKKYFYFHFPTIKLKFKIKGIKTYALKTEIKKMGFYSIPFI